jgi:hypothetical protein
MNARFEKDAVWDGFRFQAACKGLGSAVQALGSDMVRLRPCPNVRPDTGVCGYAKSEHHIIDVRDLGDYIHQQREDAREAFGRK